MKKYFKITLLILLVIFGASAMFFPMGKTIESSGTSRIWEYSLYTRIFGGGFTSSSQIKNCGPLTLAWCFTLFGLILSVLFVIFYFTNSMPERITSIALYSGICTFYLVAAILDFSACAIIGNTTDASLGIGTIFTAIALSLGFAVGAYLLLKEIFSGNN